MTGLALLLIQSVLVPLSDAPSRMLSARPPTSVAIPPLQFVQAALRDHQIVFLGDIHPLAEPKVLVSQLIQQQSEHQAINLLALEVAAEHQPWIDRYLASKPENTRLLLDHPRTLRAHWGVSAEYLEIYRAVYRWNSDHPGCMVRILAADLRGWPVAPRSPQMAANRFVTRDIWMAAGFRKMLQEHPAWRVLIFMGGYHGLKGVGGEVVMGPVHNRFRRWFAGYLTDAGAQVYSILSDSRQTGAHGATRMFDHLAGGSASNFAVALDSTTDVVEEPLYRMKQEGFELKFWPSRFPLRRAVDAMVVLNRTTPITRIQ